MRPRPVVLVAAATLLGIHPDAGSAAAPQQPITVAEVLDHAMPSDLVAASDGNRVAWVLNERGARNVWVASAPDFVGQRLTDYPWDDGQEIGALQFAGTDRLVYVRGGSRNRAGEFPNPATFAEGVEAQVIWRIDADGGGEPVRVVAGTQPRVFGDATQLLYMSGGNLMLRDLIDEPVESGAVLNRGEDASPAATPVKVLDVRGGIGGFRVSPDGTRVAFASSRGTHSYIGVVELPTGDDHEGPPRQVTWIDPSVDSDRAPVWSPDGSRLAFLRVPARRAVELFAPRREGRPWSIRVAPSAGGSSTEVFVADEGPGSVYSGLTMQYDPHANAGLAWGRDGHIAFPWEKTGWRGMYSVPASGGVAVPLAVGEFEVETADLSPEGLDVLIVSNQGDIDRRHAWRVPLDGSVPATRITGGGWIEWSPVPVGDGYAWLRSNGTTPAHAVIQPEGTAEPFALAAEAIPAEYPSARMVEPRAVTVSGADGMAIPAQLFVPADLQPGERRPAVIFFHGGSRRQMLLGFHYSGYYHNAYALSQVFASRGYIALAVNYRSGIGYGMKFREALNYGATGGSEFQDVVGAGLYLRARDDVDPARIGLWGGSYGGYLTAMGLSRASDLFAAGVDLHGVHDWNDGIRIFFPGYDPTPEAERVAFESSPNASLDTWRSPVLLIHGDDDRNVFFSQTVFLVEALRDRDVHVEQLVFPDEVHGFLLHRSWVSAYEATVDFFARMLGDAR